MTESQPFFARLREANAVRWSVMLAHPFVEGIAEGTLPVEWFRYYLAQDDHFLVDYTRALALALARADDVPTMSRLSRVLDTILNGEMALHRQFCDRWQLSPADMAAVPAHPTTRAYTDHLLRIAWSAGLPEIVASMLPCHYGYLELARGIAHRPGAVAPAPYAAWIQAYASPGYAETAAWLLDLGNRLALDCGVGRQSHLAAIYRQSLEYEIAFWDMSWQGEPPTS